MPLDAAGFAATIRRPRILARAARAGSAHYRRDRDLPGLVPTGTPAARLVDALTAAEAAYDEIRRDGSPAYAPARHVRLLSALLAEARAAEA